jgi:hypothetical protein
VSPPPLTRPPPPPPPFCFIDDANNKVFFRPLKKNASKNNVCALLDTS